MEFNEGVALVTGGTGALGSDVALELLARGVRLGVTYRTESEWEDLKRRASDHGERLAGFRGDVTRSDDANRIVGEVVARWTRLDFLVAVAGGFAAGKSYETDDLTWDHMLSLNLRSLVNFLRATVPVMIRQNFGRIVTVSSGSILRGGGAGIAAYAVSKGAVRQLTEILAEELKTYDIHVHCVMPGTMDTEANRHAMPDADFSKWVKTADVARLISLQLSDEAQDMRSVIVPALD